MLRFTTITSCSSFNVMNIQSYVIQCTYTLLTYSRTIQHFISFSLRTNMKGRTKHKKHLDENGRMNIFRVNNPQIDDITTTITKK